MGWFTSRVHLPFGDAGADLGLLRVEREVANAA
jgi:hypothetical protein